MKTQNPNDLIFSQFLCIKYLLKWVIILWDFQIFKMNLIGELDDPKYELTAVLASIDIHLDDNTSN